MNLAESNLTGLKKELESEQAVRAKAESSLQSSLEELEKIKAGFEAEKAAFQIEKATLLKCVKDAEGKLTPVTEELDGLKHHISHMTQAIFCK